MDNGAAALLPDFEEDDDPDELLSDEDAPDLQDEIAKTLTSLKVRRLKGGIARHSLILQVGLVLRADVSEPGLR